MQPEQRPDGLVVATPERVAFEYTVAGLGSRFMAQAIDVVLLLVVLLAFSLLTIFLGTAVGGGNLVVLIWVIVTFAIFVLYFPILEGVWGGQTLGKRAMRIRVLGDRGEPVTVTQVVIRNLIRVVDFLPVFYGVGIITLFIQGGSKRLGDFAAGTVVVRDRERIRLKDLVRGAGPVEPPPEPVAVASIWADRRGPDEALSEPAPGALSPYTSPYYTSPYESAARRMPGPLLRFVVAYARRRQELILPRRQHLADQVAAPLSELLPAEVETYGALAVLEGLAGLVYAPATASASSTPGSTAAASSLLPPPSRVPPQPPGPPTSGLPEAPVPPTSGLPPSV